MQYWQLKIEKKIIYKLSIHLGNTVYTRYIK